MTISIDEVFVRVASSTSNLGPGFDFLGLSLGMFLELRARTAGSTPVVRFSGVEGRQEWSPSDDLISCAIAKYEKSVSRSLPALEIEVTSEIPIGRGFGSSGAAVAAALLAAHALDLQLNPAVAHDARSASTDVLAPLALALEGHPDNGTASLLGGCTLSVPAGNGELAIVRQPVHESIAFAVAWPDTPLFTEAARKALPDEVPLEDAIENPRRLALLLDGLRTGNHKHISLGTVDRLHERFRRALIPGSDDACRGAERAGAHAAVLSGAGSGLVALAPAERIEEVAAALEQPLQGGISRVVRFVAEPPLVTTGAAPGA